MIKEANKFFTKLSCTLTALGILFFIMLFLFKEFSLFLLQIFALPAIFLAKIGLPLTTYCMECGFDGMWWPNTLGWIVNALTATWCVYFYLWLCARLFCTKKAKDECRERKAQCN